MIARLIAWCIDHRMLVLVLALIVAFAGTWATLTIPVDAIPDLSDVQVILYTPWDGRDPQTIEDQVTYPLASSMLSVPGVRDVRGSSFFGGSLLYVIFDDGTDMYWARSRVHEQLSQVRGQLPDGVDPQLGPDATGLGWVFLYTLEDSSGRQDLSDLRALQDWYVRFQLASVPGVAEVASIGGAVRQYQITVDPRLLQLYRLPLERVVRAVRESNDDAGGRLVEVTATEYMVRARGTIKDVRDLERIVLDTPANGTPVLLSDVAHIGLGPDIKRGVAEKNGRGEVVAGVVVMQHGQNALEVIDAIKAKIELIERGLPEGVMIRTAYDRSGLIRRSISTLTWTLGEELLITVLICLVFLMHIRSGLVAAAVLPLGILVSFLVMRLAGINANIMSLSGIAVAIGTMVDSSIVLVENLHKHKETAAEDTPHWELVRRSAVEVGPGLFSALLIITVSFLPVFALEDQAGRMFRPLAFTKTFAMAAAAIIAVTLIPVLLGFLVRGRVRPESHSPLNRLIIWLYLPLLRWTLRHKVIGITLALLILLVSQVPLLKVYSGFAGHVPVIGPSLKIAINKFVRHCPRVEVELPGGRTLTLDVKRLQIGEEFMPPLREGDILSMPTTLPGLSVSEARRVVQAQDQLLVQFPEVRTVLGKLGRFDTPTDPAPLSMAETHVALRPESDWPARLIEPGFLEPLARSAVRKVDAANSDEQRAETDRVAATVRRDLDRQTRHELVVALNVGLSVLAEALESHRQQQLARGQVPRSRFSNQQLEDTWAADLLDQEMARVRRRLPDRITERLARALADQLVSSQRRPADQFDQITRRLAASIDEELATAGLPMEQTTFARLTGDEMDREIRMPGLPNSWLMPIDTRIIMLTTGMRTKVGLKLYGADLETLGRLGTEIEAVLREVPGTVSVVADRVGGGHYVDINVDRAACARYGLLVRDVQRMVETAIGGMNIGTTIEGRERFPINVRYPPELRDDLDKLRAVLVATPDGAQVTLGQVADIEFADGPSVIKSEDGMLLVNIPIVIEPELDIGSYVDRAQETLERAIASGRLEFPAGYHTEWSGQYEMMQRVVGRLVTLLPITLAVIFVLIYLNHKSVIESLVTMATLPFALVGGVWGLVWLDYNWSVAVVIGFIALAGLAAETGIIMHIYLDVAHRRRREELGRELTSGELFEAIIEGAVMRVRPKLMTVLTDFLALLPILWAVTPGAGPMKRIAIPVIGGVITSAAHTLILVPVYYSIVHAWKRRRGGTT